MKALIHTKYGPPEVVSLADIPVPVPKKNEVLIKVYASTVNRTDSGFRSANYFVSRFFSGLFNPRNQVLGCEFAGEIAALGGEVTAFNIGDRVFGFNDSTFGGHAEYMTTPADKAIAIIPEGMAYEVAAALTEGCHYALGNIRAAKISKGHKVLVNGATGAIGSAAVQLCKYFGAEVVAVCETKHIDLVKSLGADTVIDYAQEDFTRMTHSFDVVFDAVGKSTFGKCKPIIKEKGIYMSTELGPNFENPFLAMFTPMLGGKKVLFPLPSINRADVEFIKKLATQGAFKPVMDRTFRAEEIVEAYKYVETGFKTGNVILSMAP